MRNILVTLGFREAITDARTALHERAYSDAVWAASLPIVLTVLLTFWGLMLFVATPLALLYLVGVL